MQERLQLSTPKKIAFSVITTVIVLVFLELSLRLFGFSYQPAGLESSTEWGVGPDPTLSWSWMPVPNATCNLSKWNFSFPFNAAGYRGPMFEKEKPPKTVRIVCMGDSVTMGWRVEDEKTFCSVLQQLLSKDLKNVETINAGVMAYTSFQGLHQLQARVLDLHPDLIVFSYNWDDHSPATTVMESFGKADSKKLEIKPDKDLPTIQAQKNSLSLIARLRVFQLVEFAVSKVRPAPQPAKLETPDARETKKGMVRVPLEDYRHNVEQMVRIAKDHHVIPVLLTEPSGAEAHGKLADDDASVKDQQIYNDEYNLAIKEIAAKENVLCVDTIPIFQKEQPGYFDAIHPRAHGHFLIAQELARAILSTYRGQLTR